MNTRILITLLLVFTAALTRAVADEWISEEYRCALTIPTQESWAPALRQPLPFGEMIFHAASMTTGHGIAITFVKEMPSGDIRNPAVIRRITELLESQGWSPDEPTHLVWKDRPFLQFISQRRDVVAGKLVGISRVTPRGRSLYIVTAYGKGEADRAVDPNFMRVMETFRLTTQAGVPMEHSAGPPVKHYRLAVIGSGSAAVLLILVLAAVLFLTRHGEKDIA